MYLQIFENWFLKDFQWKDTSLDNNSKKLKNDNEWEIFEKKLPPIEKKGKTETSNTFILELIFSVYKNLLKNEANKDCQ